MAKVTYKFELDSSEIAPLIALCKEQAQLISDFHEKGKSSELDKRVANMLEAISDMKLDDHLRKIKADAVREAAKNIGVGDSRIYRTDLVYYASELERGEK